MTFYQLQSGETTRRVELLAQHDSQITAVEDAAALLRLSVPDAREFMLRHSDEIDEALRRAELTGEYLVPLARSGLGKVVRRIEQQLASADGFEAVELSKPLLRILETHERAQLAKREAETLPLVHITIVNRVIQVRAVEKSDADAADVVDVAAHSVPDEGGSHGIA